LLLKVVVAEANAGERVVAAYVVMQLLEEHPEVFAQVEVMWVDAGYDGDKFALSIWLMLQARVEVMLLHRKLV
jgi:putative transposase